jgi:hypothetical protein
MEKDRQGTKFCLRDVDRGIRLQFMVFTNLRQFSSDAVCQAFKNKRPIPLESFLP